MANRIVPVIVRGRLYFRVAGCLFSTFRAAVCAWSAAEAQRLDIVEGAS